MNTLSCQLNDIGYTNYILLSIVFRFLAIKSCATNLIQSATDGGANDETHAKERLQVGEHRANVRRELPRDDGEAGGEEGRVADRLDDPDDKTEGDEDSRVFEVVQQPKQDGAGAGGEDAQVEHSAGAPHVDLGSDVRAGDEHGELKYAENKAVLYARE